MTAPQPLHDRALDNLQFIRSAMERAGSFTAVPGWGMVVVGCTALAATWLGLRQARAADWLAVWLGEAVLAVVVGGAALVQKARAANDPLLSGPARRFGLSFRPARSRSAWSRSWAPASWCSGPRRCSRRSAGGPGSWPRDLAASTSCLVL